MTKQRMILRLAAAAGTAAALVLAPLGAARAEFPEKPVQMTVLFGSTAKTIAQVLSDEMSKSLGKPVVPVFKPGGGGAVGYTYTASQPADGYAIVWNSNSISTTHLRGNMDLTYKDFVPIACVTSESLVVAVKADSPYKTLKDIAEAAKKSSNKLKVGTAAKGSFTHVTAAAIFDALGIGDKVIYVPLGGVGKVPPELVAGRLDVAVQFPGQFVSFLKAGEVRLIAMTAGERLSAFPDVPTAKEQGVNVELSMWRGLAAPKGTPAPVVMKLQEAAKKAAESENFKATISKLGADVKFLNHEAFEKLIVKDNDRLDGIMKKLGLENKTKS
jgi:tripartite-type tricarboxylate transporter receptor subunit TctC